MEPRSLQWEQASLEVEQTRPEKTRPLGKTEFADLSQKLNNRRIAGNTLTNFIDDINTSNEESIDEGHAPSWVLEKSARNFAAKALETGNKNWLDLIGEVDTYGGGNYAQTQKGRKIIRDTITLIDRASDKRDSDEYTKRQRVHTEKKQWFTHVLSKAFNIEDEDKRKETLKAYKKLAFSMGLSNVYQSVHNNYDLIIEREGEPKVLDDDTLIDKIQGYINVPGHYTDYDTMRAGITIFLAENNIRVGETQQSKIDSVLKAYTPLEGINEYKDLEKSVEDFGKNFIDKLSFDTKWKPQQAITEVLDQKTALTKRWREILNEHRKLVKDDPKNTTKQFITYGLWSADQKTKLYDDLISARDAHFDIARPAIRAKYDEFTPTRNDPGTNYEFNSKYKTLGTLVWRQTKGEEFKLSPEEEEELENLKAEIEARWPSKYKQYEDDRRALEKRHRKVVSFAEGADTEHTTAIRGLLAELAFESAPYIQMELNKYYDAAEGGKGIVPDEAAKAEVDLFKTGLVEVEDIPATKKSLKLFDNLIANIFPGWKEGLLNLSTLEISKGVSKMPMEALFIIGDNVDLIKAAIKERLKTKILGEGDKEGYNVPYGLWSNKQKEDFNRLTSREIEKEFLSGGFKEGEPVSELIKELKELAPDDPNAETKKAALIKKKEGLIKNAFPNLKNEDVSTEGIGRKIATIIKGTTEHGKLKEMFKRLKPLIPPNEVPRTVEGLKRGIKAFIATYYELIRTR